MHIVVLQENLYPKLQNAVRFIASRPQLPILSGICLSCQAGVLTIRSTDVKMGYQTTIGGKTQEDGVCVVPAKFLLELVAILRVGPVSLQSTQNILTVTQGKVQSTLTTFPPIDYPPFPVVGNKKIELPVKEFSQAVEKISYASSLDETRPVIASILIQLEEVECTLVATDGYRLAFQQLEIDEVSESQKILVQSRMLVEIAKIISKSQATVFSMSVSQEMAQVSFQIDDTIMIVRLTEGNFPNFRAIIPPSFSISTVVDREQLIHSLKTALVIAKESSSIVSLEIGKMSIRVCGVSQSVGENVTVLEASYAGDEKRLIACNARFILDVLMHIDAASMEISLNEELKPIRIRPQGEEKFTYIVMPFKK